MSDVRVERAEAPTDDVRLLVDDLEAELSRHYPPEQRHGLKLDALFEPHIRFFIATLDGQPAGCGGIALFPDFAELKRMYVRPGARSHGLADAILAQLTEEALGAGLSLLRLETGTQQQPAIRFYRRAGFAPCRPFEPYASMPPHEIAASVFMEMQISGK